VKTRWTRIDEVRTGSVNAEDIFDPYSFVLLIGKGTVIDSKTLQFLKNRNVSWVPVEEESDGVEKDLTLEAESEIAQSSQQMLVPDLPLILSDEKYHLTMDRFHDFASVILETGIANLTDIEDLSNDIVAEVIKTEHSILNFMTDIAPGFVVKHGINCAILAAAIGQHIRQPWHYLVQIVKVALLHDIGLIHATKEKSLFYVENVLKQFAVTPIDRVRAHPFLGVKLIERMNPDFLEPDVSRGIVHHHERFDGFGFPLGIQGKNINFFSRVLSVVDAYDTLITKVNGKSILDPYHALKWIIHNVKGIFDPDIVRAFVEIAGLYPTGTIVRLNDGRIGSVISKGDHTIARPILSIDGREVETENESGTYIVEVMGIDQVEARRRVE